MTASSYPPMSLVQHLERFNRKERYWVVRNALGPSERELSEDFRKRLAKSVGLEDIPKTAWWAVDYHLDWLFSGLIRYAESQGENLSIADPVASFLGKKYNNPVADGSGKQLIRGGIQDIDLLVVFDRTLILIEAKGVTNWSNKQLLQKCERLTEFQNYINGLVEEWPFMLATYMVLMSPREPTGTSKNLPLWPHGIRVGEDGKPFFLKLKITNKEGNFDAPERCDSDHNPSRVGEFWHIVSKPSDTVVDEIDEAVT